MSPLMLRLLPLLCIIISAHFVPRPETSPSLVYEIGSTVTFHCRLNTTTNIQSVSWYNKSRLISNHEVQNMDNLSFTDDGYVFIHELNKINNLDVDSKLYFHIKHDRTTSLLKIKARSTYDATCLTCTFTVDNEKTSATSCLKLIMKPIVVLYFRYLNNFLDVTCTVTSYPKPNVVIKFLGEVYKRDIPMVRQNENGSSTVSVSFTFKRRTKLEFVGKTISCLASSWFTNQKASALVTSGEHTVQNHDEYSKEAVKGSNSDEIVFTWIVPLILILIISVMVILISMCIVAFKS
uniref:Glycoprotein n=2 Tax=Roseolovirus TaxID=40272 RepID=Q3LHL8_HHV6H|nr:glycoprotein [Human betaherpesvirus 6B]